LFIATVINIAVDEGAQLLASLGCGLKVMTWHHTKKNRVKAIELELGFEDGGQTWN
jgi:hypothetical protein